MEIQSLTFTIIVINVIAYFLSQQNQEVYSKFIYHPHSVAHNKQWYRIITGGFLHADLFHLIFNLMTLYFFGSYMEPYLGLPYFTILYFGGLIVSSLPAYFKNKNNFNYSALGASGAVSAVLYSFIYTEPWSKINVQMFLPVPAILYGVIYIFLSAYLSKRNQDNIGHDAHIAGALFGFVFQIIFDPSTFSTFWYELTHPKF